MTARDRDPFTFVRAFLVLMPIAILAGTVLAPPDAFAQVLVIVLTVGVGMPIAVRLVNRRRYSPWRLGTFYGALLVIVLAGLWLIETSAPLPFPTLFARLAVLAIALVAADVLSFRILGSHGSDDR